MKEILAKVENMFSDKIILIILISFLYKIIPSYYFYDYLELARQCQQLVHQRASHALLPFVVRMEAVVFVSEVIFVFVHRIESRSGIPVNDRHCPHVASLFHSLHIVVDEESERVAPILGRLPVLFVSIETSTMDRSEENDLLVKVEALE